MPTATPSAVASIPAAAPRGSVRTRWTLALLFVAAVPIALISAASLYIQRAGLDASERGLQVAVIDIVSREVDRELDDAAEATHRVGRLITEGRIADESAQ